MANYPGAIADITERAGDYYNYPNYNPDTTPPIPEYNFNLLGTISVQTLQDTSSNKPGLLLDEQGNVFGNVYVIPILFDLEFITEETEHNIFIWNADNYNVANITNIAKINEDGTNFVLPTLPEVIPRGDDETHSFTVYQFGPALQDTHFVYTIDSVLYDIYVTGMRVIAFQYEPNWGRDLNFEYKLQTIMFRTESFKEQRRLLYEVPERKQGCQFLETVPNNPAFFIDIENLSKKVLAIPIYKEPVIPVEDLQGLTSIDTLESIEYYFNMQNLASLAIFLVISDRYTYELKEISSVGTNNFVTVAPVVEDFKEKDTVIYPVFIGEIDKKKHTATTDNVLITDLSFRELFL